MNRKKGMKQRKRGREDDSANTNDDVSTTAVAATSTAAVVATDEDLKCGICLELVENATQTSCCGGLWCRGCIEQIKEKKCPNCRADIEDDTITRDTRNERLSAALSRPCTNQPQGCSFSGNRKEMHEHSQSCKHASLDDLRAELAAAKADLTEIQHNYNELQDRIEGNRSAAVDHLESRSSRTMDLLLAAALGYDDIVTVLLQEGLKHEQTCVVRFSSGEIAEVHLEFSATRCLVHCYASIDADSCLDGWDIRLTILNSDGSDIEERSHKVLRLTADEDDTSTSFDGHQFSLDKNTVFALELLE